MPLSRAEINGIAADRLYRSKRGTDVLCRLGGDEFALIAEGATLEQAQVLSKRIRDEICKPVLLVQHQLEVDIDVSIGFAIASATTTDASELIRLADEAMYRAKKKPQSI